MKAVKKVVSLLAISTGLISGFCHASDSSLEEAKYSLHDNYFLGNVFTIGDTKVSVLDFSAWSDTGGSNDDLLRSSDTPHWSNCHSNSPSSCIQEIGYGQENGDYSWGGDSHSVDNYNDKGKDDFDMFLLSFDTEVVLNGAGYTWKSGSNGNKEVTVAGLNDISMFSDRLNSTWSDAAKKTNVISSGHFGISKAAGGLYESSFTNLASAKYWLVGAYNTYFGDNSASSFDGVGFKLSSLNVGIVKNTPSVDVSEPGALALMGLGLSLLLYRRKRRV
ncbi:exosortase-dependent surface protein XDP1 [Alteromonas gracilis]|uniref:exosortase-dependent surface protein XDP1 n=1 Tax=Alteromonas gracilis TaxID=1479524 RepID=UPI0037360278